LFITALYALVRGMVREQQVVATQVNRVKGVANWGKKENNI